MLTVRSLSYPVSESWIGICWVNLYNFAKSGASRQHYRGWKGTGAFTRFIVADGNSNSLNAYQYQYQFSVAAAEWPGGRGQWGKEGEKGEV